jgi:hypothetical protein
MRIRYVPAGGAFDLHAAGPHATNPERISSTEPADSAIGDFDTAFTNAAVKIDAAYATPYQHQMPMEPHATMAVWDGPKLTVHTAAQLTVSPQEGLARTFNIRKEDVRIITRYIGGGFGNKLPYYFEATLAAMGARILARPVKVAMTRPQLFHVTTHRTASEQRLRLGADSDGRLIAYGQDALVQTASFDQYVEPVMLAAPPGLRRAALMIHIGNAASPIWYRMFNDVAPTLAIEPISAPIRVQNEIEGVIKSMAAQPNGALLVTGDNLVSDPPIRRLIIDLAATYRLPALYGELQFALDGGLISYGVDRIDQFKRAASYVDRILKGERPSDLPVQQPTKFDFVINLKTAKALSLELPLTLQMTADEVIQ